MGNRKSFLCNKSNSTANTQKTQQIKPKLISLQKRKYGKQKMIFFLQEKSNTYCDGYLRLDAEPSFGNLALG